ncbi:hypothetical protein KCU71_g17679, partial [Aureobasidium melanogenum]
AYDCGQWTANSDIVAQWRKFDFAVDWCCFCFLHFCCICIFVKKPYNNTIDDLNDIIYLDNHHHLYFLGKYTNLITIFFSS